MISMVLHQIQSPQSTFKRGWEIESERRLWRPTEIHWNTLSQKVDLRDNLKYNVVSQVLNQRILTFWQRRDLHFGKRDNGNPKYASAYGESVCLVLKKSIFGAFWCVAFLYISIILSSPPVWGNKHNLQKLGIRISGPWQFQCRKEKGATKQDEESEVSVGEQVARKFPKNRKWAARSFVNDYYDNIWLKGMQRWANFIISSLNPPSS